jgi:hypothetical protein
MGLGAGWETMGVKAEANDDVRKRHVIGVCNSGNRLGEL